VTLPSQSDAADVPGLDDRHDADGAILRGKFIDLTASQTSAAQARIPSGVTGVIVTATYAHSLQFFGTLMKPWLNAHLMLTSTVAQRKN
jgi:hypothetical protein